MKINLPVDFLNRMKDYLGEEYEEFIASYDLPEIKGIRINALAPGDILGAIVPVEEKESFGNDGTSSTVKESTVKESSVNEIFKEIPWMKNGFSYLNETIRPGKHPYHEAGVFYIQEPSAMAPVTYLDVEKDDRVLDLCAAPGGKSTQIGAMLGSDGILVTNEIMPDRAKILSENIERMGIGNALVISEDPRNISDRFSGYFDKILVDAPCSGEGMFRRSETAVNEWSLDNVRICAERQSWILDEAAKMLSPGGTLVFSTCTFAKEEDEEQIKDFLSRHEEFELAEMTVFEGMKKGFEGVGIRIWPHIANGEGHYLCKLKKTDNSVSGRPENEKTVTESRLPENSAKKKIVKTPPLRGYEPDISQKDRAELKEMFLFFEKNVTDKEFLSGRRLTRFKDQVYLLPKDCPSLKGLKVLRAGLHLGTILKNRFEPGHALARVLDKDDYKLTCILPNNCAEVYKYMNGETFNMPLQNGWHLILVDDYPIGWGKVANEIVKNHYPKGLRKKLI